MKKSAIYAALLVALLAVASLAVPLVAATGNDHKVTICHVPPGNPANAHSITVDRHALKAHLGENDEGLHGGDSYGECPEPEGTPVPEPTPAQTPEPEPTPTPPTVVDPEPPLVGTPRLTLPPTDTE